MIFGHANAFEGNAQIEVFKCDFRYRTSSGKLHLVPDIGKIPLADALLIEDPSDNPEDDGKLPAHTHFPFVFIKPNHRRSNLLNKIEPHKTKIRNYYIVSNSLPFN